MNFDQLAKQYFKMYQAGDKVKIIYSRDPEYLHHGVIKSIITRPNFTEPFSYVVMIDNTMKLLIYYDWELELL